MVFKAVPFLTRKEQIRTSPFDDDVCVTSPSAYICIVLLFENGIACDVTVSTVDAIITPSPPPPSPLVETFLFVLYKKKTGLLIRFVPEIEILNRFRKQIINFWARSIDPSAPVLSSLVKMCLESVFFLLSRMGLCTSLIHINFESVFFFISFNFEEEFLLKTGVTFESERKEYKNIERALTVESRNRFFFVFSQVFKYI